MTDRLNKNLNRLAEEAGIKELTPEIRRFAWLINQDSLIGFWEASQHYAKFEGDKVDRFIKSTKENT
jgi:hypothetical protein